MKDRLFSWLGVTLLFALPLTAEDFCAVKVHVVGPEGQPASARVELVGPDGAVVGSANTENGAVAFCDFGFGEHTILVGGDTCGSVAIRHVKLTFELPKTFRVVLNQCEVDSATTPPSCLAYLRISSNDGKKIAGARLSTEGDPRAFYADSYGRLAVALLNGTSKDFRISAPGYMSESVHVFCQSYETIEKSVVLRKK